MLSCLTLNLAEYFYSVPFFILLTICSIFATFADSVLYFLGDHYASSTADIIIWILIPLIMLLFIIEYLMICRLFSCKIFNLTSCDFVYVFCILSLIIELTRITPKMKQFNYYSLSETDAEYHIDNLLYWKHKLFDSFIDFIIYLRVVHSILRAVLYYIYGKDYRQTHRHKSIRKALNKKYEKNGYQPTAADDDADHSTSCSTTNTTPDEQPQPKEQIQVIQPTIMDDADETAPLPTTDTILAARNSVELLDDDDIQDITPKQDNLAKRFKLKLNLSGPSSPAHNTLITPINMRHDDYYIDSADNSPIEGHHKSKGDHINGMTPANIQRMLSPPQLDIDPSDVDTQSIERIDPIELHTFQPTMIDNDDDEDEEEEEDDDCPVPKVDPLEEDIMIEHNSNGDNWGIFPMFASKSGIIVDLCLSLISLFTHPYLFIVRICIFTAYFILLMYVSAHHFVQFIRSFLDSNKYILDVPLTQLACAEDDNPIKKDIASKKAINFHNDGRRTSNKQIQSIVMHPKYNNPSYPNESTTVIFNAWTEDEVIEVEDESSTFPVPYASSGRDIEFRTGQDEIKKIVRLMLSQTSAFGYESRCKLENILSILQDIKVMDKGNIEEKIELDDELGMEEKQWLNQTLLSKHSMADNAATPHLHFEFNATQSMTSNLDADNNNNKDALITPLTSHDTIISPQTNNCKKQMNVISPHVMSIKEEEDDILSHTTSTRTHYEVDIAQIIEESMKRNNVQHLGERLRSLSSDLDKLTAQIMNLDGSLDTMELNRLTGRPLLHSAICIFLKYDFAEELSLNFNRFYHFLSFIESSYRSNNPYHNRMHATEVMLATMIFIDCLEPNVRAMITPLQIFCAFVSAIIHDVDHPGNNNAFEINSGSELSVLYSDESVLEFHHLQFAFCALKHEENHFTEKWDKQSWKEFRKQCIYSVLATDLSKHFATIAHIKQLKIIKETDLEYVFKAVIKMSDLSHVTKPLTQHKTWTNCITQEFHNQGDKEMCEGLEVSPLCNKENTKIAKGQVGFIKHVVSPLYAASQRFFKKNSTFDEHIMTQLNSNWKYWEQEAKTEETPKVSIKEQERKAVATSASLQRRRRSRVKENKRQRAKRPQSATFHSRRIAILTNLENTPPPILPSSVRMMTSKTLTPIGFNAARTKYFFSPNSNDFGKGANAKEITFKFEPYTKIKGRKRHRSSSNPANIAIPKAPYLVQAAVTSPDAELANRNVTCSHNKLSELMTPRSILRLGSTLSNGVISPQASISCKSKSANRDREIRIAANRSLTPQHATSTIRGFSGMVFSPQNIVTAKQYQQKKKKIMRTKSSDENATNATATLHMISPKQFISPYSISHDVQAPPQHHAITIHENKSSSDNEQHFKFDTDAADAQK